MDSPKHLSCLERNLPGQFYRISGSNRFKCKSCGVIEHISTFSAEEFLWKENPDTWRTWASKKVAEISKGHLDLIVKNAKEPRVLVK